jgi:hypothetical protein
MVNGTAVEAGKSEESVDPEDPSRRLTENHQVLQAQARELAARFGIEDPILLAAVLKVTPEVASSLLEAKMR